MRYMLDTNICIYVIRKKDSNLKELSAWCRTDRGIRQGQSRSNQRHIGLLTPSPSSASGHTGTPSGQSEPTIPRQSYAVIMPENLQGIPCYSAQRCEARG